MRPSTALALASILATSGCDFASPNAQLSRQGNGTIKEEARPVGPFAGIDVGGPIEAVVSIGPVARVTLGGDENLLPLIGTEVRRGVLFARPVTNVILKATRPLRLTVVAPGLDRLAVLDAGRVEARMEGADPKAFRVSAEGAGTATVRGIEAESIEVEAGGASRVTIEGRAGKLKARLDGASELAAGEAPAGSVEVEQAGSTRAEVRPSGSIRGRLSGASRLVILGKPGTSDVVKDGAASVETR